MESQWDIHQRYACRARNIHRTSIKRCVTYGMNQDTLIYLALAHNVNPVILNALAGNLERELVNALRRDLSDAMGPYTTRIEEDVQFATVLFGQMYLTWDEDGFFLETLDIHGTVTADYYMYGHPMINGEIVSFFDFSTRIMLIINNIKV